MGIKERSAERRKRIVGHVAKDFADAERWDLDFWQSLTPKDRLAALAEIRRDIEKIEQGRSRAASRSKRKS
jgi:hypothetical protein